MSLDCHDFRIAVFTLTMNRLDCTIDCFRNWREKNAHSHWDHFVWDNGSNEQMQQWLLREYKTGKIKDLHLNKDNVGISAAANVCLDRILRDENKYDIIIKIDNDCWMDNDETIKDISDWVYDTTFSLKTPVLASPNVFGLSLGEREAATDEIIGGRPFRHIFIGGLFHCAHRSLYYKYRAPLNRVFARGWDDSINPHVKNEGGIRGYLTDTRVTHYKSTQWQQKKYKDYFLHREEKLLKEVPSASLIDSVSWCSPS